jgi:Cu-Zn family superoxide dismutase
MIRLIPLTAAAVLIFAGCSNAERAADDAGAAVGNAASDVAADVNANVTAPEAVAHLMDAQGNEVGTAELDQEGNGVRIKVDVKGLPAGSHGIHLHMVGTCTAPDFASAGAHFNPTSKQHGLSNPNGPHAGDLPNLEVAADGTGEAELTNDRVILGEGANSVFDADGTAVVIHADADDQVTDPSGNSGARIACGVIQKD